MKDPSQISKDALSCSRNTGLKFWFELRVMERNYGSEEADFGIFLIDLSGHLERAGRENEAEAVTAMYRAILFNLAAETGILP